MKWNFSWREVAAGCIVLSLALSGCALKQGDESIRHMTREDVQQKIIIGKTTKGMVRAQFGEPTATVTGHDGNDEWRYIYSERQYDAMQFVSSLAGIGKDPKATSKILQINFNNTGIVTSFAVRDAIEQDEARWGI